MATPTVRIEVPSPPRALPRGCQPWGCRLAHWYFWSWPVGVAALWAWSPWAAWWHFFSTQAVGFYAALRANSQVFGPVVRRFATDQKEVWLTIDDGPFARDTTAMLAVLAQHGTPATFFLEGARVRGNPDVVAEIVAAGHALGNHSHSHAVARFWALGPSAARREIESCTAALRETGVEPVGFRAPVGMANGFVHLAARRCGLPMIGWSARGFDGATSRPERVVARLLAELAPGAILLLHQHRERPGAPPHSAAILTLLLAALEARGYRCVLPKADQFLTG